MNKTDKYQEALNYQLNKIGKEIDTALYKAYLIQHPEELKRLQNLTKNKHVSTKNDLKLTN